MTKKELVSSGAFKSAPDDALIVYIESDGTLHNIGSCQCRHNRTELLFCSCTRAMSKGDMLSDVQFLHANSGAEIMLSDRCGVRYSWECSVSYDNGSVVITEDF